MSKSPQLMNPFPGLRPFRQDEDYLFFGREEQTLELLQRLAGQRFVAVVGTSGSGKSSLVRCGLLSELLGGKLLQAGASWEVALTHPGGNPLALLTESLLEADLYDRDEENSRENLLATLSRSHFGLVEAIKQAGLAPDTNFLLVVDQFEELFRFHEAGQTQQEVANEFVSVLLEAATQKEVPIYVVLTMRSDFIGECGQFEGLAEMVNRGEFLIPRLTREQYKRVIEGPIKVAGGKITPRLLQRLLNDLGQQADQLPCLQHALMRTWNIWSEKGDTEALDLDDYQRVGRMAEALSLHADEVFESLANDRQRELCQGVFQALTVQESENRGIRRPQRLGTLCDILEVSRAELLPIIDAYRHQGVTFLMPSSEVALNDQTIIDISHESLMRVWTRLRHWVADEALAAGIYRRLSESASLYQQGKAGLYRDPELGIAQSWRETRRPNQAWAARYHPAFQDAVRFLDASQQAFLADQEVQERARQHELEQVRMIADAERQRAEAENRAAKRLRGLVAVLALVAAVALISSIAAFNSWRTAIAAKRDAELSEQSARRNAEAARLEAARASEQETAATVARRDAEQNLISARKAIDEFLIKVSDSQLLSTPGLQPLRAELLASASGFYEDFLNRNPDDPELQAGLADAFYRVGFVNSDLGNHEQALKDLQKSIDLWNAALRRKPDDVALRHGLANASYQTAISRIFGRGEFKLAETDGINAARVWMALVEAHPENADYKKSLARAYNVLGMVRASTDNERAFLAYQQSLKIRLELLPDHPDDVELLHGLGESFNNLGIMVGDREQRLAMLERSIEFNVEATRLQPQNVEYAMDLGIGLSVFAQNLSSLGRTEEALAAYRKNVDHALRFIKANPAVPMIRNMLFSTLTPLRSLKIDSTQADEYLRIFQDVRDVLAALERKTPDDHVAFAMIESCYAQQISHARETIQERPLTAAESAEIDKLQSGSVESLRQAVAAGYRDAQRLKQDPLLAAARLQPAFYAEIVAAIEAQKGTSDTAKKEPTQTAGPHRAVDQVRLEQDRATGYLAFGILESAYNRTPQAQQSLEQALSIRQKLADGAPENVELQSGLTSAKNLLANHYWRTGRLAKGREYHQQQIASLEKKLQDKPESKELAVQLAAVHREYADSLASVALWDEAASQYAASLKLQPKTGNSEYHEILDPAILLLEGKTQAYRTACEQVLQKFAAEESSEVTTRVARLCSLSADAVDNRAPILALAEKDKTDWHAYTWALALYRSGRFEEAIRTIEDARSRNDLAGFPLDNFVLAMAHFRLGSESRARELLDAVDRHTPRSMPSWSREPYNMLDVDWVVLRREANQLIYGSPFNVEDRIDRGRAYAQLGDSEKAQAECAILLRAQSNDHNLMIYATVLAELGLKEQATQQLEKVEKSKLPADVEFWRTYGDALKQLARHDEASLAYRHAIAVQTVYSIKSRQQRTNRKLLIELYDKLIDLFQVTSRPDETLAAQSQLDLTLAVCQLQPVIRRQVDLLSNSYQTRSTQENPLAKIDQLLEVIEKSVPDHDSIFLHYKARLHELRAEALQDAGRSDQEIAEEFARVRERYERLLEIDPHHDQAASALANLLLSRGQVSWKTLKPLDLQSKSGTTLTRLADDSILASGTNPVAETYTVVAKPEISGITAVRLETLPHPSLPLHGSGRDPNGWFYMTEVTVAVAQPGDKPIQNPAPLKLQHAVASFHRKEANGAEYPIQLAIDGEKSYGWDVWPEVYRRQEAVFEIQPDPQRKTASPWVIQLSFLGQTTNPGSLGRFRLSVTDDPNGFLREEQRLQAMQLTNPWGKLGAAYALTGATAKSVAAFAAAFEQGETYELRRKFIQAAAEHEHILAELVKLRSDDPMLQVAIADQLTQRGEKDLAATARSKARTLFEKQLTEQPAQDLAASGLADLLLTDMKPSQWKVLKPTALKAAAGTQLSVQEDGSVLASKDPAGKETYKISGKPDVRRIGAIRLETFPHSSVPGNGSGWANGNIHLTEMRAALEKASGESVPIQFQSAVADYVRPQDGGNSPNDGPAAVIDKNSSTRWDIWPHVRTPHWLSLLVAKPLEISANDYIRIELEFHDPQWTLAKLANFRLSVSDDPAAFTKDQNRINVGKLTDPWTKLLATYQLVGDQAGFDRLVQQRPQDTSALGDVYAANENWEQAIKLYDAAITVNATNPQLYVKRATAHAASQHWEQSKADWLRAVQDQPNLALKAFDHFKQSERWSEASSFGLMLIEQDPKSSLTWLAAAPVVALADDTAYRDFCTRMVDSFAKSELPEVAERTCKACLLRSGAIELSRLPSSRFVTALDNGSAPEWLLPWAWSCRALLAYRSGDAASTVRYAQQSQAHEPNHYCNCQVLTILALAQIQLHEFDAARGNLDKASEVIAQLQTNEANRIAHDVLIAQLLLREAKSQLAEQSAAAKSQ